MGLLAELVSASIDQYGNMQVIGRRQIETLLQIDLPRRRVEQVASPQHFGNVLLMIVDHDSQLVGKDLVAPSNDKVPRLFGQVLFDAALQLIVDTNEPSSCFDSERVRQLPVYFFIPTVARIGSRPLSARFRRSTQRFSGTDARIEQPLFVQQVQCMAIRLRALTLIQD